jgi:biotin transporter BioY
MGARFLIGTLVVYTAGWYWLLGRADLSLWYAAAIGIVVSLLAAGLGKLVGILVARHQLDRLTRSLHTRLANES